MPSLPPSLLTEVSVTQNTIAGIRCAIYSPTNCGDDLPLVLYMHGGGFVIGCSEDTDYITRSLCHSCRAIVVSVNYRLAPETVFPGALEDCHTVLSSLLNSESQLSRTPSAVFLAGDSAGGNLAIALFERMQTQRDAIKGLVLLAPWLDMHVENYDSYNRLAPTGIVFDAAFLGYARAAYAGYEEWKNPQASPLFCDLQHLPPTLVIVGTEDPLIDQSLALARKAHAQGCDNIETQVYQGMPHCFYSFPGLFDEELQCYARIAEFVHRQQLS